MFRKMDCGVILALIVAFVTSGWLTGEEKRAVEDSSPSPIEVFEQRIMPIFKSPEPSSCVQCHLSSVDLKEYILPSHEQTFASLRDQGLIDVDQPAKSKILTLIRMGDKDLDRGAKLIHEKTRTAEYEAFAAWIAACASDPRLRNLPALPANSVAKPDHADAVIRHTRINRVVDSFTRNVWSQRMRCFPCHTPNELDDADPKTRGAIEKHKEFMAKQGAEYGERMNIFRESPAATVQYLIEQSRKTPNGQLPLINLEDPTKSLLVLKPTAKLPAKSDNGELGKPSYVEPVTHGGGLKMHVDDQSYKSFIGWIKDYANVVGGKYTSVDELPLDNWFASKHVVVVREVPAAWEIGARVQLFVHAWNQSSNSWYERPIAFSQGSVAPLRNVAGALFVMGGGKDTGQPAKLDPENSQLAPGKYLLKVFVDKSNRLAKDPTVMLNGEDFAGQAEIDAKWGEGFPRAERVLGKALK